MAHEDVEIDSSVIEGVVADTWSTYLGTAVEPCGSEATSATGTSADSGGLARVAGVTGAGRTDGTADRPVEARIRLTGEGEAEWAVSLLGSWNSAEEATRRMLESGGQAGASPERSSSDPECVLDAWGELANTLAGNLKAAFGLATHRLSVPDVSSEPPPPASTRDAAELLFDWDGYRAMVRFVKITPA